MFIAWAEAAQLEPLDAESMEFEDAVARLEDLLATLEWPTRIVWVKPEQVLVFPLRSTIVFRPDPDASAKASARTLFEHRSASAAAVSLYSPGHANGRTFAYVAAIEELADGEEMFLVDAGGKAWRSAASLSS